jgi:hypothetical protein
MWMEDRDVAHAIVINMARGELVGGVGFLVDVSSARERRGIMFGIVEGWEGVVLLVVIVELEGWFENGKMIPLCFCCV